MDMGAGVAPAPPYQVAPETRRRDFVFKTHDICGRLPSPDRCGACIGPARVAPWSLKVRKGGRGALSADRGPGARAQIGTVKMDDFGRIVTVLSMILGLGVTRLLLGVVTVFRIRRDSSADWVPLAWAAVLFATQLQFWWAITQLPRIMHTFSFPSFLLLVLLTLMLFLSAALLLPSRTEDELGGLRAYFERDGRYALLALSGFLLLAFLVNVSFFEASPLSTWGLLDVPIILMPVIAFLARRHVYATVTLLYVPLYALDTWISL
jgi:hypothetical protein